MLPAHDQHRLKWAISHEKYNECIFLLDSFTSVDTKERPLFLSPDNISPHLIKVGFEATDSLNDLVVYVCFYQKFPQTYIKQFDSI